VPKVVNVFAHVTALLPALMIAPPLVLSNVPPLRNSVPAPLPRAEAWFTFNVPLVSVVLPV